MMKGGQASRSGSAVRSNPAAGVGDVNSKVSSSRVSSSNTSGKKRSESASTSAAGAGAPRSKELKQSSTLQPPQEMDHNHTVFNFMSAINQIIEDELNDNHVEEYIKLVQELEREEQASRSKRQKQPNNGISKDISDTGSEETDLSTSEGDDSSWISWFCGLRGNELLCEVDEDYIQDDFNLCGLQGQVPFYDYALDMILDNDSLSEVDGDEQNEIESAAELLYGLIHARYIITSKGLNAMHEKFKRADFGRCPRVFCGGQPCLPVGPSDIPRNGSVKIYCPKCEEMYFPRCKYQNNMDGSYIGTTFPHLYLMTYPSAKPAKPATTYEPRVFGFKLHKGSR